MEEEGSNSNNNNTTSCPPLKIYFLPFPTPGHMIPMVDLARVFATRSSNDDIHVTLLTTPSNAQPLLQNKQQQFHIHTFDFPSNQIGLPPGLENLSSAKDGGTAHKVCTAVTNLLIPQIESFVKQNPPHAFIPDFMFTASFSFSHLGIPIIPFIPSSIFSACIFEAINDNSHVSLASSDSVKTSITVPGDLPHPVTLHVNPSRGFHTLARPFLQAKHNGRKHGIIVNSFAELEAGYTEYYQKLTGVRVWHLGISSLMVKNEYPLRDNIDECLLSWLSTKEPNSVVYICFGTLCLLRRQQCLELARGIEASRKGFLWVVPEDDEEFQVPEGFGDEGKRGKVVRGWVPQVLILNHPAIGAFFTHCGWTSVGEGISAGLPMITMPRFGEQFFNERLVNEVHGLGVEVGAWEWSMSPYDAKNKVVSWERIEKAVRMVMEADSGGTLRKRAKEMKEKACKAVQQGGSSYHNLTSLIQSLKQTSLDGRWLDAN